MCSPGRSTGTPQEWLIVGKWDGSGWIPHLPQCLSSFFAYEWPFCNITTTRRTKSNEPANRWCGQKCLVLMVRVHGARRWCARCVKPITRDYVHTYTLLHSKRLSVFSQVEFIFMKSGWARPGLHHQGKKRQNGMVVMPPGITQLMGISQLLCTVACVCVCVYVAVSGFQTRRFLHSRHFNTAFVDSPLLHTSPLWMECKTCSHMPATMFRPTMRNNGLGGSVVDVFIRPTGAAGWCTCFSG